MLQQLLQRLLLQLLSVTAAVGGGDGAVVRDAAGCLCVDFCVLSYREFVQRSFLGWGDGWGVDGVGWIDLLEGCHF